MAGVRLASPGKHMSYGKCVWQAYGARRHAMLGIVLQRAVLICTLAFGFILLFWTQLDRLLLLAGELASFVMCTIALCL